MWMSSACGLDRRRAGPAGWPPSGHGLGLSEIALAMMGKRSAAQTWWILLEAFPCETLVTRLADCGRRKRPPLYQRPRLPRQGLAGLASSNAALSCSNLLCRARSSPQAQQTFSTPARRGRLRSNRTASQEFSSAAKSPVLPPAWRAIGGSAAPRPRCKGARRCWASAGVFSAALLLALGFRLRRCRQLEHGRALTDVKQRRLAEWMLPSWLRRSRRACGRLVGLAHRRASILNPVRLSSANGAAAPILSPSPRMGSSMPGRFKQSHRTRTNNGRIGRQLRIN